MRFLLRDDYKVGLFRETIALLAGICILKYFSYGINDSLMFLSYNLNTKYLVMKALFDITYLVFIVISLLGPLSGQGYSKEAFTILLSVILLFVTMFPSVENFVLFNNSSTFHSQFITNKRVHIIDSEVSQQTLIYFIMLLMFIFFGIYILIFYA